jgi:hypothetical protein
VPEDFSDPGDRNYPFPKEMPQLINKVLKGRQLDSQKAMVFDAQGAIVTTLPDRMERAFSCQSSQKKGIILWGLSDFKTMRSISQTHYHARDWAKRILEALTPKGTVPIKDSELKDKKVIQDALVSLLSRLFKAFDPVKLAERIATGDGLAFQASLIKVLKSYEVSLASLNGAIPRCDKKRTERKLVDQESASQKNQLMHTFREQIDSIDTIQGLVQTLRQLLTNDLSNNVLLAAHTSGVALAELFREHFCLLDYPRSVVRAISELISEDYNVVNGRIPPHYKAIAADASITRSGSTSMLANLDADFFKITPLHMAAIAGNLPVASWLIKKAEADLTCLTMDEDQKRLVPFDYALAYCKDNGVNLDLLRILSHGDFSGEIQEKVCERIDDDSDKVLVLEKFRAQFGNHIITEPDEELFILAILQGYDELANLLFDKTSADSRSAFLSARMDARAKGDLETAQRLSNWVKKHYPSLQLIDETLSEASLGCNKEALENKYSGT